MSSLAKALTAFQGLTEGDVALAIADLDADRYVEHDPAVRDGVAGVSRQVRESNLGEQQRRVIRTLADDDHIMIQSDGKIGDNGTFFDVFRFEQGLIVEHWSFAAPSAPPNESGHTQVDGPTKARADIDAERSKTVVREYYEAVHLSGRHDQIRRFMSADTQIRHEPGVADGVDAFERDLEVLTRNRTIDEIRLLLSEGDLVFLVAMGTHDGEPCAYVDLYRVEADKLVEHWGFPQPVPPPASRRNRHGLVGATG